MNSTLPSDPVAACLKAFPKRRVLVLGDAILDEYVHGDCSRISPEAPVPVVRVTQIRPVLGGAANAAANMVSLGGNVTLVAHVGNDEGGAKLRDCAMRAGVELRAVDAGVPTLRKIRVVSQHQQVVRLDHEDVRPASDAVNDAVFTAYADALEQCDIVVISDYAKGLLSSSLAQAVIQRAHEVKRLVLVDPRPQHREHYRSCDYITPNWKEARALLGLPDQEPSTGLVRSVASSLASKLHANVVLTLGAQGISFCSRDTAEQFSLPTLAKEVFDVSGAGDTVVAAFALAVASGVSHPIAVELANRAAGVVVGKIGTATVTPDEVLHDTGAPRLVPREALAQLGAIVRARGKRLVTVNGSFDLLHAGHLHILNEARQQGDILLVGLNSDASVRAYKGPDRPIVPEQRRAEMLLALRMVHYVHIFDEPNPTAFLEELRPHVHVNGAEYGEDCIESEVVRRHGGAIHLVARLPNLSTSGLLDQLRSGGPLPSATDQP